MDNDLSASAFNIPGVDVQCGIKMTGGKKERYIEVLSIFINDVEKRLPLNLFLSDTNTLSFFITHVHAIKSASASVGAAFVSKEAAQLEKAGRNGDMAFIHENLDSFTNHITELIKNIKTVLALNKVHDENPSCPSDFFSPVLQGLEEALKSQNISEIDRILEELNQKTMDSNAKQVLEKISFYVLIAEFNSALKALAEVQKNAGKFS